MTDLEAMFSDIQVPGQEVTPAPAVPTPPVAPVVPDVPMPAPVPEPVAPPHVPEPVAQPTPVPTPPVAPQPVAPQPVAPTPAPMPAPAAPVLNVTPTVGVMPAGTMPMVTPMAPAVPQSTAMQAVGNDFSIDLPDSLKAQLSEEGTTIGDIGMKVSRVPIEKYRASASKIDRIGFITNKVIPIKYHYIPEKGYILCFNGKCCEIQGNPTIRYLFPIVVYQTDAEGSVCGGKVQLNMLAAGDDLYKTIQTLHRGSASVGGIDKIDLLVTCTDEHYQKLTLVQAGPALWRTSMQMAEYLRDQWLKNADKAYMAVARKVDEFSFLKMIDASDDGTDTNAGAPTYDASQTQDLSKFFS